MSTAIDKKKKEEEEEVNEALLLNFQKSILNIPEVTFKKKKTMCVEFIIEKRLKNYTPSVIDDQVANIFNKTFEFLEHSKKNC